MGPEDVETWYPCTCPEAGNLYGKTTISDPQHASLLLHLPWSSPGAGAIGDPKNEIFPKFRKRTRCGNRCGSLDVWLASTVDIGIACRLAIFNAGLLLATIFQNCSHRSIA